MTLPTVAIVGRPNVGKSTLFNRIAGERISIVEDVEGVTRDRIYTSAEWLNRQFSLIDTGGIDDVDAPFMEQIKHQAGIAMTEADVIVFVVSGKEGVTDADEYVARILYKTNKPVILAVNKVDNPEMRADIYDFYSLGLGDPYPVSSVHGIGTGDVLDAIVENLPTEVEEENPDIIRFSLIGRPNVGKSSLINAILGEDRVIASPIAGTTRDAIDTNFVDSEGQEYTMIDTAGMRKSGKVYENTEKQRFTIGIVDDVTNLSLPVGAPLVTTPEGTINCKFWGLGADGTVGANKNSIKIIGDNTDMYAQAYFDYDSKKSGGVTMSHLRFGKKPIKSTYLIHKANFVACHNPSYVNKYHMVEELVDGGTFLLNCPWDEAGLEEHLPGQVKAFIANHNIKFYVIDGVKIGIETGMGPTRINTILQSAFFKLAKIIPEEKAIELMKAAAKATYGRKGDDVVAKNWAAIDEGAKQIKEVAVPESWKNAEDEGLTTTHAESGRADAVKFVNTIQAKVTSQEGNNLPVSAFADYVDGTTPSGTSAYEKRGIAVNVPVWNPENCIQCNRCSFVCPHAVIRPVAMTAEEAAAAPEGIQTMPMTGMPDYTFTMAISQLDCTGSGSCANVCPGKKGVKALAMESLAAHEAEQKYFDYAAALPEKTDVVAKFKENTVKGSQFKKPLLEFSGACAGCGETPYAKLITQLFGDRMYIANATGCSSIWGNSSPSTPYTVNEKGQGPAWSNSLFEDNAEFGYGMLLAQKAIRGGLKAKVEDVMNSEKAPEEVKAACKEYLDTFDCGATNGTATEKLVEAIKDADCDTCRDIVKNKDFLAKKSQWIFGGDGWAYDIGFGGVDHVLASGKDINVMVFDTEVYSNTGGQSSKATPTGAVAQFAAGGKETKKKDMASIAMSYGYVYVAQIAMGADYNQAVKAIAEAEAYPGPSLIIAYAPCINHGIKKGMSKAQTEEQLAVQTGYWHCFRFNPALAAEGKSAFTLDSKAPSGDYQEFLNGEVRYNSLKRANPAKAERLFGKNEQEAKDRYTYLNKLVKLYGSEE